MMKRCVGLNIPSLVEFGTTMTLLHVNREVIVFKTKNLEFFYYLVHTCTLSRSSS